MILIIVLGNMINEDLTINPLLKSRLDKSIELYDKLKENCKIVLSGGKTSIDISEADVMAEYLIKNNIPKDTLILEDKSVNTIENVINVKPIIEKESPSKIIVITSEYHMPRTRAIFKRVFMNNDKNFNFEYLETQSLINNRTLINLILKEIRLMENPIYELFDKYKI